MKRRAPRSAGGVGPLWGLAAAVFTAGFGGLLLVRLSQAPAIPLGFLLAAIFFFFALAVSAASAGRGDAAALLAAGLTLAGLGLLARLRLGDSTWPSLRADWGLPIGVGVALLLRRGLGGGRHQGLANGAGLAGGASIALLVVMAIFGQRFRGGLYLAGLTNPSELIKILLPICYAGILAKHGTSLGKGALPRPPARLLFALALFAGLPLALLALHRDFGLALLLCATLVAMLALAGGKTWHALAGYLALTAIAVVTFQTVAHARVRWQVWRNPFQDEAGSGWQVLQGLAALYHGGLWGRGLGAGFPHLVPIAASDFIYAVWGEEIGFLGCGLLLLLYGALVAAGLRVAGRQRDDFSRLLAAGLTVMLAAQTLLHTAGVTKAIPLTGIPLPLVSHGGSSLVVSLGMVGLLAALADAAPGRRLRATPRERRRKET